MLTKFIILTFTIKAILAQINGEFWWLSDKLSQLKGVEAPKPSFEDISEFETDESAKVIFRDEDLHSNKPENNTLSAEDKPEKLTIEIHFTNENKIVWPDDSKRLANKDNNLATEVLQSLSKNQAEKKDEDIFKFYFPGDQDIITKNFVSNSTTMKINKQNNNKNLIKDQSKDRIKISAIKNDASHSESICTYLKKSECYRQNGFAYKQVNSIDSIVCCVLPLLNEESSRIIFPDSQTKNTRSKRASEQPNNPDFNQRNFLLQRKYSTASNPQINQKQIQAKVVSSDEEYVDPYWNIKSSNLKNTKTPKNPLGTKNDCYQDYVDDYVIEVPKPGLVGLYSDHGGPSGKPQYENKEPSYSGPVDDYDYNDGPPGYSTIDPRRSTASPISAKPSKFTTSAEASYDPEKQIISYESRPDFQVLQGFKLLNLAKNKNKFYSKNTRRSTTAESLIEENGEESIISEFSSETLNKDFKDQQVYKNCGIARTSAVDTGKRSGNSASGSHPWLALVVLTKRLQGILCYATIIHPRAAITSADCVHGSPDGEITLIAGLWNLSDRSLAQSRIVSIRLDPQYKSNGVTQSLAVMYWNHPLRLNVNVQPACLGHSKAENCKLFGWGGFDQAIRPRSRWQEATVLKPRQCLAWLPNSKRNRLPEDAFCASVQTRGTVTGVGGPLVCNVDGISSVVGVAVFRDSLLVFLPIREWLLQALPTILES